MKITIISSSTRVGRKSHRIALLLKSEIEKTGFCEANLIDLAEINIPLFDQRFIYMDNQPEILKSISEELKSSDAIIFVTPEYNGSISPALKNLIDIFGANEFAFKPLGVASVSSSKLGGIRAALQLQQIILSINGFPFPKMLLADQVSDNVDYNGTIINPEFSAKLEKFLLPYINFAYRLKETNDLSLKASK